MPFFNVPCRELMELRKLPRRLRLLRLTVHRHMIGLLLGFLLMAIGSYMSTHHETLAPHVWHWLWDCISYGLHGFGAIPIYGHTEALWEVFS